MGDGTAWASKEVSGAGISAIKEMAMRAATVPDVASLAWGLPSFRTPAHIRRAVAAAIESDADIGKYTLPDGLPALRRAAAQAHHGATGRAVDPDRHVSITAGNMEGVQTLLGTILDPGDEVIVTDPGFASHILQIRLCGGRPVFWPLDEAAGWALDLDRLPGLVTGRTKAILLVSPSNPTGRIFDEAALRALGGVAARHGLLIILDDPYTHFTYENRERCFNPGVGARIRRPRRLPLHLFQMPRHERLAARLHGAAGGTEGGAPQGARRDHDLRPAHLAGRGAGGAHRRPGASAGLRGGAGSPARPHLPEARCGAACLLL
ncbi:MAG TPA: pyridoxal phosphate-dependent aminotransferase, partial [Alphaproteobacteria bacterium]|nr:pyridoxal phosphate-dependent aminotransferase [Alphaproteobacteria bacterium]